jgi:uncharacterized protein YbaA (DUF1428 family)
MAYVDGFVLPVPRKNLTAYRKLARKAGPIWLEHGALEYRECVGEDLDVKMGMPFPRQLRLKRGETVVFSWIVYRSRADRDRVNARVMKDPRITSMPGEMPFDTGRMLYGGFETLVHLGPASAPKKRPRRPARPRRNGHATRADRVAELMTERPAPPP